MKTYVRKTVLFSTLLLTLPLSSCSLLDIIPDSVSSPVKEQISKPAELLNDVIVQIKSFITSSPDVTPIKKELVTYLIKDKPANQKMKEQRKINKTVNKKREKAPEKDDDGIINKIDNRIKSLAKNTSQFFLSIDPQKIIFGKSRNVIPISKQFSDFLITDITKTSKNQTNFFKFPDFTFPDFKSFFKKTKSTIKEKEKKNRITEEKEPLHKRFLSIFTIRTDNEKKGSKQVTKRRKKKSKEPRIYVGITNDYSSTLEGNLSSLIVKDYCKSQSIPVSVKKYKHAHELMEEIVRKPLKIVITSNDETNFLKQQSGIYRSQPLFSKAMNYIIHDHNSQDFKYPDSIYGMVTGLQYMSEEYTRFENIFGLDDNSMVYVHEKNLINDFNNRKTELIVTSRDTWYTNAHRIPGVMHFYIEYGKPYGYIYFTTESMRSDFSEYMISVTGNGHDWLHLVQSRVPILELKDITNTINSTVTSR
jgi:hypothetical protein